MRAGAISAAIVLAFLLVVLLGRRRSDTLDVMSGIGDERGRLLYTRAVAIFGASVIGAVAILARRS